MRYKRNDFGHMLETVIKQRDEDLLWAVEGEKQLWEIATMGKR